MGLDNGLVPTRRQAIIWTIDDFLTDALFMRHSASMSLTISKCCINRFFYAQLKKMRLSKEDKKARLAWDY